jgi:hypothetical protein
VLDTLECVDEAAQRFRLANLFGEPLLAHRSELGHLDAPPPRPQEGEGHRTGTEQKSNPDNRHESRSNATVRAARFGVREQASCATASTSTRAVSSDPHPLSLSMRRRSRSSEEPLRYTTVADNGQHCRRERHRREREHREYATRSTVGDEHRSTGASL